MLPVVDDPPHVLRGLQYHGHEAALSMRPCIVFLEGTSVTCRFFKIRDTALLLARTYSSSSLLLEDHTSKRSVLMASATA